MPHMRARGRVRAWGIAAVSMGLLAVGAAVVGSAPAAVSAAPDETCDTAYPVDELVDGAPVHGLSVTKGTTPDPFTGNVIGVLEDGIAPDLDMILVELEMPELDKAGGIWQGMSGSPVYAEDNRLIGAVAYGLSWGPSPIAGVTPFEDMDDYLATEPVGRVEVDRGTARTIARETDVTAAQAEQGLAHLKIPMGINGLTSQRLEKAAGLDKPYAPKGAYGLGQSSEAAGPETIVKGGNLAASVAYGDITMAGVGTVTSLCNGKVVGFGHPMTFRGETTMSLHPAEALLIQPESLGAPFKVANIGDPVGAITQDRLAGISGTVGVGEVPDSADLTSSVSYRGEGRTGETHVTVSDYTADALFGQYISNHDRVLDGIVKGSEVQEWTITGKRPNGSEFSLEYADRYTSKYDITWYSVFELADLVWSLSSVPGVTITSVDVSSDVIDETGTWTVSSVQQRRAGEWHKLTRRAPAVARAGKTLRLRTVLTGPAGTRTLPVSFEVPRRAKRDLALLSVSGGGDIHNNSYVDSVKAAERMVDSAVRNDELQVQFGTPNKIGFGGYDEEIEIEFGPRRYSFVKSRVLGPFDRVVDGSKLLPVIVR